MQIALTENPLVTSAEHLGHWHLLDDIDERTKNYFKFTMVRNPWARLLSFYQYCVQKKKTHNYVHPTSFKDFVLDSTDKYLLGVNWTFSPTLKEICCYARTQRCRLELQLDWITDANGKILIDFIGKVENLQEDFNTVCDKIGIPRRTLSHQNKSNHKAYTKYYDDETQQIIAEKYAEDIKCFGYEFGE